MRVANIMKNIIKIFLASNILAFGSVDLTAADATVSSSGNWSESSTWGGSYPGSAVDTLNFTQGGLELVVDSNASAKQILLHDDDGYTNNASIVINQGVSFNIGGISPAIKGADNPAPSGDNWKTILTFSGAGTLNISLPQSSYISYGKYIFNADVVNDGPTNLSLQLSNATMDVNGTWNGNQTIDMFANSVLNVNGSMNVYNVKGWAQCNINVNAGGTLNIQKNPNYSWATGMYGRIGTVDGSLIVDSGAENSERYSLRLGCDDNNRWDGKWTIGSTGTIKVMSYSKYYFQVRNTALTINSAAKSLYSNNTILFGGYSANASGGSIGDTSVVFNTSNPFTVSTSSQAESSFAIGLVNASGKKAASSVKFTLNADNSFGEIEFFQANADVANTLQADSVLTIAANGHLVNIGKLSLEGADYSELAEDHVYLKLQALTDWTVQLANIETVNTQLIFEDDSYEVYKTSNIQFSTAEDSDTYLDAYLVKNKLDENGYFINTSSAVPEASTYAAIMGVVALAASLLRRRRR